LGRTKFQVPVSISRWFIVVAACLIPTPAYTQRVLFGVKVAGQITSTFEPPFVPNVIHEDRILFGPTAEVHLLWRLSLEVDALHKRKLNYTQNSVFLDATRFEQTFATTDGTSRSWEVPVILKWHVVERPHTIFVGGGISPRNVIGNAHTYGTTVSLLPATTFDFRTQGAANPWTYGPVFTAGIDLRAGIFHFQPELRYTRWNDSPFSFVTKVDSFQALIGISVGKTKQHQ
jgi:hypothetical protein